MTFRSLSNYIYIHTYTCIETHESTHLQTRRCGPVSVWAAAWECPCWSQRRWSEQAARCVPSRTCTQRVWVCLCVWVDTMVTCVCYMYMRVNIYMRLNVNIYIYIHIRIRTYMYTHIYIRIIRKMVCMQRISLVSASMVSAHTYYAYINA